MLFSKRWVAVLTLAVIAACTNTSGVVGPGGNDGGIDATVDVAVACATGEQRCDNRCVNVQTSRDHCGMCGAACEGGRVCVAGRCQVACPTGQTECGGV